MIIQLIQACAPPSRTPRSFDAKETSWLQMLDSAGQSWSSNATGLVVRLVAAYAGSATVTVCRPAGAETAASCSAGLDNDCNGLVGTQDPACARFAQLAGRQQPPLPIRRQPRKVAAPPPSPVRRVKRT